MSAKSQNSKVPGIEEIVQIGSVEAPWMFIPVGNGESVFSNQQCQYRLIVSMSQTSWILRLASIYVDVSSFEEGFVSNHFVNEKLSSGVMHGHSPEEPSHLSLSRSFIPRKSKCLQGRIIAPLSVGPILTFE